MKKDNNMNRSVHFTSPQEMESQQVQEQVLQYKPMSECRQFVIQGINDCTSKLKLFTQNDPQVKRKDTAQGLTTILDNLKFALMHLNLGSFEDKQQNYHLAYNGTAMILDICQLLRASQYSSLTIDYLAFAICTLESHLILLNIKFLEFRAKFYIELAHVYEEIGSNDAALKTIDLALQKVKQIQEILEQDPPLPSQTLKILENVYRILRNLEIKYKLQLNQLQGDGYKKKLDEYFPTDREGQLFQYLGKVAAIIESLRTPSYNCVEQKSKGHAPWKDQAVKQAYDMLKGEIEIIVNYIKQELAIIEKPQETDMTEEKRIKIFQDNMNAVKIEKSRFKEATKSIPLEYHIELCMHAYDVGQIALFEDLSQNALFRSKYRCIEIQYITEIKIYVSSHPNPNIDNEFEIIPQDINEAQLKILMKKHKIFKDDGPKQDAQVDPKGKDAKKGGKDQKAQETKQDDKDTKIQEAVPGIKHLYTYILVKRSITPTDAICGFKVLLAPEGDLNSPELKPLIEAGWRIIECPVQQYTGVRETQKRAIYICYKCTAENLKDEEEKKNLLLDIKPVFAKSPLARPDFGYQIIDVDLRQTPKEFIKHPDNDYLYISYKNNQEFFSNERMLKLIIQLHELEKTFGKDKASNINELRQLELDVNYDTAKLKQFFQTIKESLEGPLGIAFYEDRKEFLIKLMFYVWKKYMTSQLYQFESIYDMTLQQEITQQEYQQYMDHIIPIKQIFKIGLKQINLILVKDPTRSLIWFIKSTMELTKILMQDDENQDASQFLKTCYDMVVIYRDEQLNRGVESRRDLFLPYSLTANNQEIGTLIQKIINSYVDYKNDLDCRIRAKQREKDFKTQLIPDEQKEELQEYLDYKQLINGDDNRDKEYFDHLPTDNFIPQLDLIINALQVELISSYYRCQIIEGKKLQKLEMKQNKNNENISSGMTKKLEMTKGKSYQDTKQKRNTLENDLQNAGKLVVPQPSAQEYEKRLKNHANKNPYLMSILYMLMAHRLKQRKQAESKNLLQQSFDQIKIAQEMEKKMMQQSEKDAVFICSTLLDNKIQNQKSGQKHPFKMLYNQIYIQESEIPRAPIFLSRTSSSITMKLPPFNPKLSEAEASMAGQKEIKSMVLYGKVSAHGVNVSHTCTDLQNTGVRNEIGSVIQVRQLQQNEGYCFAVGGFDVNESDNKKVGETSSPFVTLQPMPINQLYAHLAKQAYWKQEYEIADKAATKNIEFFVESSEVFDRFLDQENQIVIYRIKQKAFKDVSYIEIQSFAESLFIKTRCMQQMEKDKISPLQRHLNLCKQACFSLLGLEACAVSQQFVVGKRMLLDLYNNISEIIRIKSRYLFQCLIKMYIFLQDIPKQYWDSHLREFSAKLIYQISIVCFQFNQINLGKLVIFQSNQLPNRKYKAIPKMIEVAEESLAKGAPAGKAPPKQQVPTEDIKMVAKVVYTLSEQPSYQDYLEDALLNFTEDYGDLVAGFLDNWKEQLDYYGQYIENGNEQIEQLKNNLSIKWQFWETLKEPVSALQKIQVNFKNHPNYMEMLCKFARRQIELNQIKSAKEILVQAEQVTNDSINILMKIFQLKSECAQKDIAWIPDSLEQLKSEKESNGDQEDIRIGIFTEYFSLLENLNKDNYSCLWRAEFYYLKALSTYLEKQPATKDSTPDVYFEMNRLDLEKINDQAKEVQELNTKNLNQSEQDFFKEIKSLLAMAAHYAVNCDAKFQLKNIVKFAQNICIQQQLNPFDIRNTDANLYAFMIGDSMLQIFIDKVPYKENLEQNLTKDFWYNKAEMQPYADFASFVINALFIEQKHSVLSEFCKNFCNMTQHGYSNIVIPFIIKSQTILEDNAIQNTQQKLKLLDERTQQFEQWKNKRKKNNRVAQLSTEIPQEEKDYEHDKSIITHQINICKKKQNAITDKKQNAQIILKESNRDTNQAQLQLFEQKRALEKFAESLKLNLPDVQKKMKKANILTFEYLKKNYKIVIDALQKRKDNLDLIRAYSQLGDLYFAHQQISEATDTWNDALDTIFQKIHSLKHQNQLQFEIGERQCLSACVFLYKLAKNCYFDNLYLQKETFILAATLSFQVFKTQMVNPQTLIAFADTRNILLPIDLFNMNLDPILTMQACDFLIQGLIDNDMNLQVLPLIQIMDYISTKICFSDFYSTRAKLFKSVVLSNIGMINQSYQILQQIQNEKCGPIPMLQQSEYLSLQKGQNWFGQNRDYLNNMPYFQESNKDVIDIIEKQLQLPQNFDQRHSQLNNYLFQFARIKLLFQIHDQEIIDRPEVAEQRINMLKNLEIKSRELLVQIQKNEDLLQFDYINQGSFSNQEAREDRLQMIYRSRFLLANITLSLGQNTRSYFILKTGLDVIQNHVFELPNAEQGKEPENEEQQQVKDPKDNKKPAKPETKDNKKGGKAQVEEKVVEEKKFEYDYATLQQKTKRKHLNGFWYLKYKITMAWIFYYQNRLENCKHLLKQIKKDCEILSNRQVILMADEIEGRVLIKMGQIKDGVIKLNDYINNIHHKDINSGRVYGDLAEIQFEQGLYEEAFKNFYEAHIIFNQCKKELRYEQQQSINKKSEIEQVSCNDKYQFPMDVMEQLSKKESKIRKDDKKGGGKDAVKKDNKGKTGQDTQEMKIQLLNPLQTQDYTQIQKPSLKGLKFDEPQPLTIYTKFLEDYVRSTLRLCKCQLYLNQLDGLIDILEKVEFFIAGNFNLTYSFKLELYYLQGITYKRIFINQLENFYKGFEKQQDIYKGKIKKLLDKTPYRDLLRNKYLLELPNFSNFLKFELIPKYLEKSKKAFNNAKDIIKGECIYYEGNMKIETILMETADLILLQREYMPKVGFKYITNIEHEKLQIFEDQQKLEKLNFELEAFQNMLFAINASTCRKEILQTSLGTVNIPDTVKITQDLINEILEADFIYKKKYDPLLFDESKNKKTAVTSLDLISLLNKINRESKIMTFSGNKCQKTILKVHRILKSFHNQYNTKCMLATLDNQLKTASSVDFIEDGQFKFKSIYCDVQKEYKFVYILSRFLKKSINTKLSKEELDKVLIGEDTEVLYGSFYISSQQLSDIEIQVHNLRSKLLESELKEKTVKERDFRRLNNDFLAIFDFIGKIFQKRSPQASKKSSSVEYDVRTDKLLEFIPPLSLQSVDYFVNMFGPEGLTAENHNLLVLFRSYHKNKYR